MVAILMISAKLDTLDILKIKVFWIERFNVISYVCDFTNKYLSRNSNYLADVVMWPKFGNSSVSMREIIISIL